MTRPRNALLLSALVCPGAGQWVQGRKLASIAYGLSFLFMALVLAAVWGRYFHHLVDSWLAMLTGDYAPDPAMPRIRDLMMPLVIAVAIYVANVYDVWWSDRKSRHATPSSHGR